MRRTVNKATLILCALLLAGCDGVTKRMLRDHEWTTMSTIVGAYDVFSDELTVLEERTVDGELIRKIPYRTEDMQGILDKWRLGVFQGLGEGVYTVVSRPSQNEFTVTFTPMNTLEANGILNSTGRVDAFCVSPDVSTPE